MRNDLTNHVGELIVTGKDRVKIALGLCKPVGIHVRFTGHETIVPCDPHTHDRVECHVKWSWWRWTYILTIKWHVSGVRHIAWSTKQLK